MTQSKLVKNKIRFVLIIFCLVFNNAWADIFDDLRKELASDRIEYEENGQLDEFMEALDAHNKTYGTDLSLSSETNMSNNSTSSTSLNLDTPIGIGPVDTSFGGNSGTTNQLSFQDLPSFGGGSGSMSSETGSAGAGFPIIDLSAIAELIINVINKTIQAENWQSTKLKQMDNDAIQTADIIDHKNNSTANKIIRLNKAHENIQNNKILEYLMVPPDLCNELSISKLLEKTICGAVENVAQKEYLDEEKKKKFNYIDKKPLEVDNEILKRNKELVNYAAEVNPELFTENSSDIDLGKSIINSELLISSDNYLALTKEQAESARYFIGLILPTPLYNAPSVGNEYIDNRNKEKIMTQEAFRSIEFEAFKNLLELRLSTENKPAKLDLLNRYTDRLFSVVKIEDVEKINLPISNDEILGETYARINNFSEEQTTLEQALATNIYPRTAILKKQLMIESFNTYLMLSQYGESLNTEMLYVKKLINLLQKDI